MFFDKYIWLHVFFLQNFDIEALQLFFERAYESVLLVFIHSTMLLFEFFFSFPPVFFDVLFPDFMHLETAISVTDKFNVVVIIEKLVEFLLAFEFIKIYFPFISDLKFFQK